MENKHEQIRKCRLCHEIKPITDFEIDKRYESGYSTRCKACKTASNTKAARAHYRMAKRAEADKADYNVTVKDIEALFDRFDGHCAYCNDEPIDEGNLNIDHVIPTSFGGSYNIENLIISCASCNAKKGSFPLPEFYYRNKDVFSAVNYATVISYLAFINRMTPTQYKMMIAKEYANYEVNRFNEWCDKAKGVD